MTGVVTLSLELELGWGMHDMGVFSHLSDDRSSEEVALSRLLHSCDKNNISVSFDIVGHLFHDSCDGHHEGPYPGSWWKHDPGSSDREDPLFYAPGLVEDIIDTPTEHEICTHTYSHMLAEDMSADLLRHELTLVRDIHRNWHLPSPKSIVMPRHQDVDYSILSEYGITTIRRPIRAYGKAGANPVSKLWWLVTRDHPRCEIKTTEGLIETTCTPHPSLASTTLPAGQEKAAPYFRALPQRAREYMHRKYLMDAVRLAANKDDHVHLWAHLFNIANESQWRAIGPFLDFLGHLQNRGEVDVVLMCDISDKIETGQ